jgi:Tfp pilus assembly protein PilN
MFAIDLLKGKAMPAKVNIKKFLFKALFIIIPVLATTTLSLLYQTEKASAQTLQQTIHRKQLELNQYGSDVAEYNRFSKQIRKMDQCLNEISKALAYRVQVSDILNELVQALPDIIFIHEMNMDRVSIEKAVKEKDSQKKKLLVQRKIKLVLCGFNPDQSDQAVQDYLRALDKSTLLSEVFTEIKASARQQDRIGQKEAIFYEIECVLREQE